jgi:competence protein ComEC
MNLSLIAFTLGLFIKKTNLRFILSSLCLLFLGITIASHFESQLSKYQLFLNRNIYVLAEIKDDPAYNAKNQYEFYIHKNKINLKTNNLENDLEYIQSLPELTALPGRIKITTSQPITLKRGSVIFVSGKLQKGYGNKQGTINYANISLIEPSSLLSEKFRSRFIANINSYLPEPHGSLSIGFLMGSRSGIGQDLEDKLRITGLSHIVAVSGYNLTILVMATESFITRGSKFQKLIIKLILIYGFLLMSGFGPSISRAVIVSLIGLFAGYVGRKVSPLNTILISGLITAYHNPLYFWFDIGWWLSFLAFFGILILAPKLKSIFSNLKTKSTENKDSLTTKIISKKAITLKDMVLETISAQILTIPIIIYIFGKISLVSLLANILVVPTIPIIMLLTFLIGIFGFFANLILIPIIFITTQIINYIIFIVEYCSRLSWSQKEVSITKLEMLICYFLILIFVSIKNSNHKKV